MEIDFGTYHHTTPEESMQVREWTREYFSKLMLSLYDANSELEILDAGCGLGFLSSVAASCFPNAKITGVDTFSHESISGSTLSKARENMRIIGIESRVKLLQHDLRNRLEGHGDYDLVISNLVFHNLGIGRFEAYSNLFDVLKVNGYFMDGDLFPHWKKDLEFFDRISKVVNVSEPVSMGKTVYRMMDWKNKWAYRVLTLNKI